MFCVSDDFQNLENARNVETETNRYMGLSISKNIILKSIRFLYYMRCEGVRCQWCGHCVDLDDTSEHEGCRDYYYFILDERIERLKRELVVLFTLRYGLK